MIREFVHALGEEIRAVGGGYTLDREATVSIDDRTVLVLYGHALFDATCCGVSGAGYALVPGFLRRRHIRRDDHGHWVSEVEPVEDEAYRVRIEALARGLGGVGQVVFW